MEFDNKILASISLGLLVIGLILFFTSRSSESSSKKSSHCRPSIFILGPNYSGKTSFFYRISQEEEDNKFISTVSSLEPSFRDIKFPLSKPSIGCNYQVIDYPGHLKYDTLLHNLMTEEVTLRNIKCIIYMLDSSYNSVNSASFERAAKQLFNLIPFTESRPNGVDILFAVNKQDLFDSLPSQKIRTMLELELNKLIKNELEEKKLANDNSQEDDIDQIAYNRREFWSSVVGTSMEFKFTMLEGNMDFISGTVSKNKIEPWKNWIDEMVMN